MFQIPLLHKHVQCYSILPIALIAFGIVFWTVFFYIGEQKYDKMIEDFKGRVIEGNIIVIKEAIEGFF